MIIVKTKNGDSFINDKAVTLVRHNKEKATVSYFCDETGNTGNINDVEGVIYNNESQPISWQDNGSEIERLKVTIEKKDKEYGQMLEHSRFMRESFFIYQNAFYDIKNAVFRSKNGSKCEDSVIDAIIDEAEKKDKELQKRFEEVRAKWDK